MQVGYRGAGVFSRNKDPACSSERKLAASAPCSLLAQPNPCSPTLSATSSDGPLIEPWKTASESGPSFRDGFVGKYELYPGVEKLASANLGWFPRSTCFPLKQVRFAQDVSSFSPIHLLRRERVSIEIDRLEVRYKRWRDLIYKWTELNWRNRAAKNFRLRVC